MLIRVEYRDGHFDMVKPAVLKQHLRADAIMKFWRNHAWVHADYSPLREEMSTRYAGSERRQMAA